MKKSVLILLAAASFAAAQCPTWVGRNETYAVGTIVEYNGSNYEAIREGGNGWTSPADTWFWSATSKTCTASSSSDASSSSSASNADLMAAISALSAKIDSLHVAQSTSTTHPSSFIDERDGQRYKSVAIGSQTWMAQNLNYAGADESTCYDNDASNCDLYGRLYSLQSAATACPTGWHLPSEHEWNILFAYIDLMNGPTEGDAIKNMKGSIDGKTWTSSFVGNDAFGFSALPGGRYSATGSGTYYDRYTKALFWTSTYSTTKFVYARVTHTEPGIINQSAQFDLWLSVRCIQDK